MGGSAKKLPDRQLEQRVQLVAGGVAEAAVATVCARGQSTDRYRQHQSTLPPTNAMLCGACARRGIRGLLGE
jgi:hypothetical protein